MWSNRTDAFPHSPAPDWDNAPSVIGMSEGKRVCCPSRGFSKFHGRVVECGVSIYRRIGNIYKCNGCDTEYEVTEAPAPEATDG